MLILYASRYVYFAGAFFLEWIEGGEVLSVGRVLLVMKGT